MSGLRPDDSAVTRLLLKYGADPNATDSKFLETPLFQAARLGNVERIRLLIEAGADVNAVSNTPWAHSAIDEAADAEQEQAVQELVRAGARDPRVTPANGEALPRDGDGPLMVCRAYAEATLARNRETLRSLMTPREPGFFQGIDLEEWRKAYPTTIEDFGGYMNESAATVTVQGRTADGTLKRWVYQMRRESGVWTIHQAWPREPMTAAAAPVRGVPRRP